MKRTMGITLATLALAAGTTVLGTAGASQAAVACGSGMVCIYPQTNYGGVPYVRRASDGGARFQNQPINDNTFSVINNSGRTARIYRNSLYGGSHTCILPNGRIADLQSYSVGRWGSSVRINDDRCG
ncbi:peptidase inhibitor family I36 protein [Streptomyces sp. H27-D2]|uniref:peptidase inhibitor family I36 protein n=1 Tax=Streptomyces sp. H27-D2 TaxID=3046304 RepID=UPI002DB7303B|nr:peptidase inhibitor family I36 protein [Streptomyces sp. H27-D2]MEC4015370.1 peptidase inhibitor family I36 protein [Streptomyces sp. H27-D2]